VPQHYNIPLFIPHLGCPFQCIFCNQNKIASSRGVPAISDLTAIIDEYLSTMADDSENIEIAFFGGSFTAIDHELQGRYLAAVQPYLKSGRIGSIRISTRPDYIDDRILSFLAGYGVKTIELGVQSLCDEVLKASGRGYSRDDVFKASHHIKDRGFKLGLQLMIGLPGDNYERDLDSTRQAAALNPDLVRIYPTLVIADTPLESLFHEHKYVPLSLPEAVAVCKDMFLIFQQQDINVIRMGLQPGEELRSPGAVVAGPFHPSFGELVEQEVFKEQAGMALGNYKEKAGLKPDLVLMVHEKDISKMTGPRKSNLLFLKNEWQLESLKVKAHPDLVRDTVAVAPASDSRPALILTRKQFLLSKGQC